MRIILLLIVSVVLNLVNVQTSNAQGKPVITNAVKKLYNKSDVSCPDANDGQITVTATGGSGKYEYSKDEGNTWQPGRIFTGLVHNTTYGIFVRDTVTKEVSLRKPVTLKLLKPVTITSQEVRNVPKCLAYPTGSLSVVASGGTGELKWSINNGATFQKNGYFGNLPEGVYQVLVQDLNGCYTISEPIELKAQPIIGTIVSKTAISCNNPLGSVTIKILGSDGSTFFMVSLDGQEPVSVGKHVTYTFTNLAEGPHQITMIDNYTECTGILNFEITTSISSFLSASLSGNSNLCQGENATLVINIKRQEGISISKDTYTATYKDNSGKNYTVANLVKEENTISLGQLASTKTFTLVSLVSSSGCSGSVSGSANIIVNPSGTWLGVNSNWHDPKNWTCGKVPTGTTNVTIGKTNNNPQVLNQTAFANNITIVDGASLKTISTLQIFGNISNAGSFDATEGALEFKGKSIQTISGSMFKDKTIGNLIVSNTAGLEVSKVTGDTLNITGNLTFGTETASLNTGDNITLKSTILGTANIGVVDPGNRISGKFIVERYINTGTDKSLGQHGKAWMLMATPTKGSTIFDSWQEGEMSNGKLPMQDLHKGFGTLLTTGYKNVPANGFDYYTSPGPSMKTYVSATNTFDKGPVSTNDPIYNEKGYLIMVRGDRSVYTSNAPAIPVILRTKGEIITGTTKEIPVPAGKWESIGNPYASRIYINKIQMGGDVNEFIFIWDPKLGGAYGLGAYQTLYKDGESYYAMPGGGSYGRGAVTFIESGQAFLVQTTEGEGSVSFTEDAKLPPVKSSIQRGAGTSSKVSSLRTSIYGLSTGAPVLADGNLVLMDDSFSNDLDGHDARKMSNSAENFSIRSGGKLLTVESRQNFSGSDTLFFNMTGMVAQKYSMEIISENMARPGMQAWLEDKFLQTKTALDLTANTAIEFTISSQAGANASDRFRIIFRPAMVLPVTFTEVKATKTNENILIEWKVEAESNLKQYEVEKSLDGINFSKAATVLANKSNGGNYIWMDQSPVSGYNYYRIRSVDLDGKTSLTQIVKIKTDVSIGSISVYPNPIANGIVNLQLGNQPEGIYNLRLLNPVGQVLLTKKINHPGGNHTEKINWDHSLPRGMYTLEVSNTQTGIKIIKVMY